MIESIIIRSNNIPKRFVPKELDFKAFLVVYEASKGEWKGFTHPYGETTEANSKKEAISKLKDLTGAYDRMLKNYQYPSNLMSGHLEDPMDRGVFSWVTRNKSLTEKVFSKLGKADSPHCYVEAYGRKT